MYQPPPAQPPAPPRRRPLWLIPLAVLAALVLAGSGVAIGAVIARSGDGGPAAAPTTPPPPPSPKDAPGTIPARFAGDWSGEGRYFAADDKWHSLRLTVELPERAKSSTWSGHYDDDFVCSGILQVQRVTADTLTLYRYITKGARAGEGCSPTAAGYLVVKLLPDGKAQARFYASRKALDTDDHVEEAPLARG
ncbi:hypothetical protein ACQEU3_21840 [Spirillospora sp. CA-253888]